MDWAEPDELMTQGLDFGLHFKDYLNKYKITEKTLIMR